MAKKVELTRPKLKRYREALRRDERYLPMLKLKQQRLQVMLRDVVQERLEVAVADWGLLLGIGLATGMADMLSASMQGLVGAVGIRALSGGGGKGLAFIIIAMGIIETVGIFAMVFSLDMIPST